MLDRWHVGASFEVDVCAGGGALCYVSGDRLYVWGDVVVCCLLIFTIEVAVMEGFNWILSQFSPLARGCQVDGEELVSYAHYPVVTH